MSFSDPIYLLVLVPAIVWLYIVSRQMHGMAKVRKRLAIGLRALVLLVLTLALAGLQSVRVNSGTTTLFVLDRSASINVQAAKSGEAFIRKSLEALGPDDQAGLVVFGKEPVIDVNTGSLRTLGKIYANPDSSATDIAAAIRLASASFGDGTAKRIVLLSDGNETSGDAVQAATVAATNGIQIDYVAPDPDERQSGEVVLNDLVLPAEVTRGEPFEARVIAEVTKATDGVIRLDRNGIPVAQVPVHLSKGTNSLVVSQTLAEPGFFRYRAVLEADADTDVRNNVGIGYVSVRGRPRVLLIEGQPGSSVALARALSLYNMDVVRAGAEGLPTRPDDIQEFDSVLFSDFSAQFLTDGQMRQISTSVRDTGVGFGMIGGENSFLSGGYYETPIAEMLPVDLNVRQRKVFPSTTLIIVADTSGSMGMIEDGVPKVKIAATAAAATVRMMSPNDYVGVAGSTDAIEFVAPIQKAVDKEKIAEECGRLDVGGGGIYIRPSLEFAEKALARQDTRVRHLILMADGNDCDEQEGALDVARRMVAQHMTVSVVAIGDGKDVAFCKELAAVGKGAFYLALHGRDLQRLFTRDTSMMTRSAIEEGTFLPKVDPSDDVLRGLDLRSMPPLHAYCLTSDRPLSRTPMRTAKDDPLLAFWQYGLGTSMAFTSDAQPKWARPWMGWRDFNAFWAQAVRSTLRRASKNHMQITTRREGGKGVIDLEALDPSGKPINDSAAHVNVISPDGTSRQIDIVQQGPGRYKGAFDVLETGGYVVSVAEENGAKPAMITRAGFSVAYPPEYQAIRPNTALLAQAAQVTGGEALTSPVKSFRQSSKPGKSVRDLWPELLLLAALLFPLDVAVRRLALPIAQIWAAIAALFARVLGRRRLVPVSVGQPQSMARLHQAKKSGEVRPSSPGMPVFPVDSNGEPPMPVGPKSALPPAAAGGGAPLSTAQRLLDAKRTRDEKK